MKVRQGFVSNSSSSSFLIVVDKDIKSVDDLEGILSWDTFQRLLNLRLERSQSLLDKDEWLSITKHRMAEILFKGLSIMRKSCEGKTYKDTFCTIFDKSFLKKAHLPNLGKIRNKMHSHDNKFDMDYWSWDLIATPDEVEMAYRNYARHNLNHEVYKCGKSCHNKDLTNTLFFNVGNDSDELYDAKERGDLTEDEFNILADLRYMDLFESLFHDYYVASENYS